MTVAATAPAVHTVAESQAASRLHAVLTLIGQQREKWALPADARVVVSYEAGQDDLGSAMRLSGRLVNRVSSD